jgi:glycerol-3-phosphate acyltransferase PlsY
MDFIVFALKVIAGYLLGSISSSLLLGRARGIDIRTQGSGNAGGTNAFRTQGAAFALVVIAVDVGKGALSTWLGMQQAFGAQPLLPVPGDALAAAAAATCGHVWPIYYGFRGGKGAGTLIGALLVALPAVVPLLLLAWLLILTTTGYVGLATVIAGLLLPPVTGWLAPGNDALLVFAGAAAAFLLWTHRDNLARLAAGNENRFERARVLLPRRWRGGPS